MLGGVEGEGEWEGGKEKHGGGRVRRGEIANNRETGVFASLFARVFLLAESRTRGGGDLIFFLFK